MSRVHTTLRTREKNGPRGYLLPTAVITPALSMYQNHLQYLLCLASPYIAFVCCCAIGFLLSPRCSSSVFSHPSRPVLGPPPRDLCAKIQIFSSRSAFVCITYTYDTMFGRARVCTFSSTANLTSLPPTTPRRTDIHTDSGICMAARPQARGRRR